MSEITRNQAIQIVEDIRTAISAGSVTNTMEAQVLEYCVSVLGRRIVEASQSEHIENLPDVAAFLAGISPSATLKALLEGITDAVEVINANIGNGYVYAGIATPSGTPVSGKVFYLAKQAGQYANFGGLTVTEGVNILKRNGSTWTQEQLLSMADIRKNPLIGYYECDTAGDTSAKTVTAAGYVLPATGGSVKIKMANRNTVANATLNINSTGAKPLYYNGQRAGVGNTWDTNEIIEVFYDGAKYQAYNVAGCNGDGVFDISAYNLTDGQPTPYEDLAAALGPNGDNVPLSLRKGGMSIKFVQGSGNKYVQFRYVGTSTAATFTNVDNWQGVDETPIAGSKNLVDSWGILKRILLESKYQEDVLNKIGSWTIRQDYTDKVGYSGDGHNGTITALVGGNVSKPGRPNFDISNLEDDCYYIFTATIYSQNSLGYVAFGYDSSAILYNYSYLKDINGNNVEIPSGVSQTINVIFKKESGKNYIYTTVNSFAEGETINISNFGFTKLASFVFDNEPNESNDAPLVLSSKVVYNAVNSVGLSRLSFKGNDDTYSGNKYHLPLVKGHIYRISLADILDLSTVTTDNGYVLSFSYMLKGNTSYNNFYNVKKPDYSESLKYLYFECKVDIDSIDHFVFGGRSKYGTVIEATIEDVTDELSLDSVNWNRNFNNDDIPLFDGRVGGAFRGNNTLLGTIYNIIYKVNDFIHINASVPDGYKMMTAIHPTFMQAFLNSSESRHAFGCGFNNDANKYSQYRWGDSNYKTGFLMIRIAKNDDSIITDEELAEIKAGLKYEFYPLSSYGNQCLLQHQSDTANGKELTTLDFEFISTQSSGGKIDNNPTRARFIYQNIIGSYNVEINIDNALVNIPTIVYDAITCSEIELAMRSYGDSIVNNGWVGQSEVYPLNLESYKIFLVYFKKSDNTAFTYEELEAIKSGVSINLINTKVDASKDILHIYSVENSTDYIVESSYVANVPRLNATYTFKLPAGIKGRLAYGSSYNNLTNYTSWVENGGSVTVPVSGLNFKLQIANSDDRLIAASDVRTLLINKKILVYYNNTELGVADRNYEAERYVKAALIRMNYIDQADVIAHGGLDNMPIIAHISDLHGDIKRFENFLNYLKTLSVDAAVVSGDSVLSRTTNGTGFLKDAIDGLSGHSIIHCLGNHESLNLPSDTVDRNAWLFEHHISPFAVGYKETSVIDATKPYYFVDYSTKNMRVITIDQYDNGCYWGAGLGGRLGQTQVTWLCNTLLSTPAGYGVVIVMHSPETKVNTPQDMMSWNQTINIDGTNEDETGYAVNGLYVNASRPIRTIIDAFISKEHIVTSYTENTRDYNNGETVSIDADFTQVNEGVEFICYLTGHRHRDNMGYADGATNLQLMLNIVTGNCYYPRTTALSMAECCDLPRGDKGATQDAFNIYAIDRKAGNVKIARVGSNVNFEGIERKFLIAPYRD